MNDDATIKDIAQQTGFSTATISRVINGLDIVKESTRKKIVKAIEEMNYTPNLLAKSFKTKRTYSIGVIIPDIIGTFFAEIVSGIESVLNAKGYNVILCHSKEDHEKEKKEIEILINKRVDGLIIVPSADMNDKSYYENLKSKKIKFALIGRYFLNSDFDYISSADEDGAYKMTSFLIKSGYRKIGFIAGLPNNSSSMHRLTGYKKALKENEIKIDDRLIKDGGYDDNDGYTIMQQFFNDNDVPEVVFAVNDFTAIGVIRAIHEKGMDVPNDIGVAGYGNMKFGEMISPPLTTVHQPKYKMGIEAARILLSKIENNNTQIKQINLNVKLLIRESTKI